MIFGEIENLILTVHSYAVPYGMVRLPYGVAILPYLVNVEFSPPSPEEVGSLLKGREEVPLFKSTENSFRLPAPLKNEDSSKWVLLIIMVKLEFSTET